MTLPVYFIALMSLVSCGGSTDTNQTDSASSTLTNQGEEKSAQGEHRPVFMPPAQLSPKTNPAIVLKDRGPLLSQDEIGASAHRLISGTVSGTCNGRLVVDYYQDISVSLSDTPTGDSPRPLARLDLDGSGPFTLKAPTGYKGSLQALCDTDRDGQIEGSGDLISTSAFVAHSGDASDLDLPLSSHINAVLSNESQDKNADGGFMNLRNRQPLQSQSDLANGDHQSLSGEVVGTCSGRLVVELFNAPEVNVDGPDGPPPQPAATVVLKTAGPFTLLTPPNPSGSLQALCDNDRNGIIEQGVDAMSLPLFVKHAEGLNSFQLQLGADMDPMKRASADPKYGLKDPLFGDMAKNLRYDLGQMAPKFAQGDLNDGVQIEGTVVGDCSGMLRVDVLPKGFNANPGDTYQPLSAKVISGSETFNIRAPLGQPLSLLAICDTNNNQGLEPGIDLMSVPFPLDSPEGPPAIHTVKLVMNLLPEEDLRPKPPEAQPPDDQILPPMEQGK